MSYEQLTQAVADLAVSTTELKQKATAALVAAGAKLKVNAAYPFTFVAGQAQYDVEVISGDPTITTAGMVLWVESAIEYAFTVDSMKKFTLVSPEVYADGQQMRIIVNARYDHLFEQLDTLFESEKAKRTQDYLSYLDAMGLEAEVPYAAGIEIVRTTQVVRYLDVNYRPLRTALPFTTSTWAGDQGKLIQAEDITLRQNMADPTVGGTLLAYSPPGFPAVVTNIRELFDNHREMGVPITDKLFGAGSGKTAAQNTIALQAAHDAAAEAAGGVIHIPGGGAFNYNEVRISQENIHIQGPGWLANGRLWIGDLGTAKKTLDFRISTNFTYDSLQPDNIPIKLLYAVKGSILFSRFKNCDKAIYTAPANTWQQVARVTVAFCEFDTINYGAYLDRNVGYLNYETADLRFLFNTYLNCQRDHIFGRGVDGISLIGEKYFFPGFNQQHATKGRNIDLQHVNWVHISNCDLFEAGLEAVKIGNFQNLKMGPNNIAWPGQRLMSSAILLYNGDRTGATWVGDVEQPGDIYSLSSIDAQNIMFPTKHGIEIDQYTGNIQVAMSQIRNPGNASFYYGAEDINAITHYAVDSSGPNNRIDAQLSDKTSRVTGSGSALMRTFIGNEDQTAGLVSTVLVATAVLNVDNVAQVNLAFSTAGTITDFVGFFMWDRKRITVTSFNGNATIQNSALIHTTSGANLTLVAQKPVQFERIAGSWYQV